MISVFYWKYSSLSSKFFYKPKDFLLMICQMHFFAFLRDLEQTTDLVAVLKSHAHWGYVFDSSQLLEGYSGLPLLFSNSKQMHGGGIISHWVCYTQRDLENHHRVWYTREGLLPIKEKWKFLIPVRTSGKDICPV